MMSPDLLVQMAYSPNIDQGFRFTPDAARNVRLFDM